MSKKVEAAKENGLIVVTQLPVIKDQLQAVKTSIDERVKTALSLVCTEDNYKQVKEVRSALNKEYQELEKRRKEVKASILAPYEEFEVVYKECAGDAYLRADRELKAKIDEVENGLKKQKADELAAYFAEYRLAVGIADDFVQLSDAKIKIGLSDSRTSLHKQAKEFLDRIVADIKVIETMDQQTALEVMAEYRGKYVLSEALLIVQNRQKLLEEERRRREEAEQKAQKQSEATSAVEQVIAEALTAPVKVEAKEPTEEKVYKTTFRVTATLDKLKALKGFLKEGGYQYEQC